MKVKVILVTILTLLIGINIADAKDEYTLTFRLQNKWVDQKDITPVRELIETLKSQPLLSIKAICSESDTFCKERTNILNVILKAQGVSQRVSKIEKSKSLDKNTMVIKLTHLDKNKYDIKFIHYENNKSTPITKSQKDFKKLLAKSELKYLSQFRFYCKKQNALCENRFNYINNKIAKTLTFKYNISLAINPKLKENQTAIASYRHDYNFMPKEVAIKKEPANATQKTKPVPTKKAKPVKYTKDPYIIVFERNSAVLSPTEKRKIEKFIKENPHNKFYFACNRAEPELCEVRVREIKFHALTATDNLIELYQLEESANPDYIIIKPAK